MPVLENARTENANSGKCQYWKFRHWKTPVLEKVRNGKWMYSVLLWKMNFYSFSCSGGLLYHPQMIQTIRHPPNIPLPQKSDMPKQRIPLNIAFVTFRMATVSSAIFQRRNFQYYHFPEAYCYFAIPKFFCAAIFQWHFLDHFSASFAFEQNIAWFANDCNYNKKTALLIFIVGIPQHILLQPVNETK